MGTLHGKYGTFFWSKIFFLENDWEAYPNASATCRRHAGGMAAILWAHFGCRMQIFWSKFFFLENDWEAFPNASATCRRHGGGMAAIPAILQGP